MHVTHADLHARVRAGAAELQRRVERLLGAAVVGRVVERDAEALVELGGDRGEVVLERQREAAAHRLQPALVVAVLGARHALEPDARGSAGRARPARLGLRARARRASSIASPWRAASRRWLAIASCSTAASAGRPCRGVGRRRRAGARANAASRSPLQLEHRRELPLRPRQRELVARGGAQRAELAPRARRLGQLAGQPRAARVALERLAAALLVAALGPQLERLAVRRGGVAVARGRPRTPRRRAAAPRAPARPRARRASAWRPRGSARPRPRAPRRAPGAATAAASTGRRRRAPRA